MKTLFAGEDFEVERVQELELDLRSTKSIAFVLSTPVQQSL